MKDSGGGAGGGGGGGNGGGLGGGGNGGNGGGGSSNINIGGSSPLPRYDPKRKQRQRLFFRYVLVPAGVVFGGAALLAVARLAHGGAGAEDATAAVWQSLSEPPAALYRCMNEGFTSQQTTYDDFAQGEPARLRLHRAWWSGAAAKRKPGQGAPPLTIATGLNPGRLDQLQSQCQSWGGPLSAAVYLVLPQYEGYVPTPKEEGHDEAAAATTPEAAAGDGDGAAADGSADPDGLTPASRATLAEAERAVADFHARAEKGENGMRCQLDAMLLYETVADDRMAVLLPINAMRNYALLQARSPLVAMVDVDLVVSSALGAWLDRPANVELLRAGAAAKRVFVLPAFETAPQDNATLAHELADGAARMAKPALASLTAGRLVYQFALYLFRQGHNCTDYPRWFRSEAPYEIAPYDGYEPWFATGRLANPFYDAVYRGYGWNKVSHVDNVKHRNFTFIAHPSGFLVHRQHARSSADRMYQEQKGKYEEEARAAANNGGGAAAQAAAQAAAAARAETKAAAAASGANLAALTHGFRDAMLEAMRGRRYVPAVDEGVAGCLRQLGWWKGYSGMDL